MPLSLKQSTAIADMANLLYDFLPWSGDPSWKGHVSFQTICQKIGLSAFWRPGSKTPGITSLLEQTLDKRPGSYERLILETVRAGIAYRKRKGDPIKPQEIDTLNGLILETGFKFPDLWDPEFHASLRINAGERARERMNAALNEDKTKAVELDTTRAELAALRDQLFLLQSEQDRHKAGYALEKLLNRLFALEGLAPREPFKITGEQIDGSFELDHETYLLEAKWEKGPLPEGPLLEFRGKIEGKSSYTRGLFLAMNGISGEAAEAIRTGKQPTFFLVTGHDVAMILGGDTDLKAFLRQRRRLLAEEGLVAVPYQQLWRGRGG